MIRAAWRRVNLRRMVNEDSNYKRAEDQEWRKTVETRLVSLTSAQKTTDDDLDKHDGRIEEIEELLEGDPLKREDSGLKGDVKELNRSVNELRAIMAPDHLGHGGIKHRLDAVENALGLKVENSIGRWKAVVAAISATALITSAVVYNLDRITASLRKFLGQDVVLISKPQRKRSGKTSRSHRPRAVEMPTEATDGDQEDVPEGRIGNGSYPK